MPPASALDFGDVQFDSDREIASENEPGSDCDCNTASEQSNKSDSDPKQQLTDSEIDPAYPIFPISFAKADEVCVRLNDLMQSGRIPKNKIIHKYLDK